MVIWCSTRFLSDASSSAALRWSASGSPVRGVVPAIGWARTMSPTRETSSSGLAPTKPSTAKHNAAGWRRRRRSRRDAASSGTSVSICSSRASTTLVSSPARMRCVAAATESVQSSALTTLRTRTSWGAGTPSVSTASAVAGPSPCAATVLTHRVPSAERPNTTAGTTRVAAARRSNGSAPKATGPDPGVRTSSSVGIDRSTSVTRPMWSVHGAGSSMRRASPTPLSSRRGERNAVTVRSAPGSPGSRSAARVVQTSRVASFTRCPAWR